MSKVGSACFSVCADPPDLAYYRGLVTSGSANDAMRWWTIALTEYIFMSGAMIVIYDRDRACPSYYTYNYRFNNLSGYLLFPLSYRILDALRYLSLYTFALRMDTNSVLTAVVFHHFGELEWARPAVLLCLVSYDFQSC